MLTRQGVRYHPRPKAPSWMPEFLDVTGEEMPSAPVVSAAIA